MTHTTTATGKRDADETRALHTRGMRIRRRRLFAICPEMLGVLETVPSGTRVTVYHCPGSQTLPSMSTHPDRVWDCSEWSTPRAAYRWAMVRYRPGGSHAPGMCGSAP